MILTLQMKKLRWSSKVTYRGMSRVHVVTEFGVKEVTWGGKCPVLSGGPRDLLSHFLLFHLSLPISGKDEMTLERQRGVTAETEGWVGWPMAEASLPEVRGDIEATPCPSILELEELLRAGKISSCNRADEVWPNLYIGDA